MQKFKFIRSGTWQTAFFPSPGDHLPTWSALARSCTHRAQVERDLPLRTRAQGWERPSRYFCGGIFGRWPQGWRPRGVGAAHSGVGGRGLRGARCARCGPLQALRSARPGPRGSTGSERGAGAAAAPSAAASSTLQGAAAGSGSRVQSSACFCNCFDDAFECSHHYRDAAALLMTTIY